MKKYKILEYLDEKNRSPFRKWLNEQTSQVKARMQARIFRFELGNLGDTKSVGEGVYEARFDFGPGYRLYFGIHKGELIILLIAGDKDSQKRDIKNAREYWKDYLKEQEHG